MNEHSVFLLLGANLGEREAMLAKAARLIAERIGLIKAQSHLYETAPWGMIDQPAFLNQVLEVKTALLPEAVLVQTLEMEKQLGRERRMRWGARVIDIDMLYFAGVILETEALHLPHPRLHQRRFTLVPLAEIAPDFMHPVLHKTNQQLLCECTDDSQVSVCE
ncbi:2-amino-4-hydroxy-6-hydroxymethyldihydropteridine diphosphokinase [Runella slithyformis]|uniref:2-amino-4-hydroxy-6-hydroxymethyldihydropteridine pyrophosphokinase n=1 Tax=Runella slithyformis (strain ATCC 29530 / DSM 19594 / LMG 11500 / NCIMB 11436 / LSU 4) TaxID=761193 RepID=A0A7U3ZLJ2_RUNSL|nr:2-amino-4-hydroxy-6-hydroxymethyldihydropteridine diphosphokinase [Runella slithyformis]AEI49427.1 2-amino-4-hydroxy-6-hydroxymethyldihydropteridine pyrophosphokinase [Runella slithyformis DSM 19594]